VQITINIKTAELPEPEEWMRLTRYLINQQRDTNFEGVETLACTFIPSEFRSEEQYTNTLYNEPVWRTRDDSDFSLWLYADGSDSEG
jgi:hypothetical protein